MQLKSLTIRTSKANKIYISRSINHAIVGAAVAGELALLALSAPLCTMRIIPGWILTFSQASQTFSCGWLRNVHIMQDHISSGSSLSDSERDSSSSSSLGGAAEAARAACSAAAWAARAAWVSTATLLCSSMNSWNCRCCSENSYDGGGCSIIDG